jgi:serine/threonine protein kinase
MLCASTAPVLPLPGYRLTEFLGKGGFGEVWKCEAPGGVFKAVKIVHGRADGLDEEHAAVDQEWSAFQHVKSFRHPFLISIDRADIVDGSLIIVMELADRNLDDVLRQHREQGRAGVPRAELLAYLREAAEALDWMSIEHGVQHLDIKPQNLFLIAGHVKVGDFGLVNRLNESGLNSSGAPAGLAPRYSAPEIFLGTFSSGSDQYSLAILYHELLTGQPPFTGQNARQLSLMHLNEKPKLSRLPLSDQPVVARALSKNPEERFPTCLEFVRALVASEIGSAAVPAPREMQSDAASVDSRPVITAETVKDLSWLRQRSKPDAAAAKAARAAATTLSAASGKLAAYKFLECLHSGPLYELWRAEAPDQEIRLVRIVRGYGHVHSFPEKEIAAKLASINHRSLVPLELLQIDVGWITLDSEFYEKSLLDRFNEYRNDSRPGISREELLDYVTDAAAALDALHNQFEIRHDWVNPRNMVLHNDRILLDGFGLAQLFWLPAGHKAELINGPYAAPELFSGRPHIHSDQYSLAVVYCEMLTGQHPFRKQGVRRATHDRRSPMLELLSDADRSVIARALAGDPEQRFPSCMAMAQALDIESSPDKREEHGLEVCLPSVITPPGSYELAADAASLTTPEQVVAEFITQSLMQSPDAQRKDKTVFHDRFITSTPATALPARTELFRQQWQGEYLRKEDSSVLIRVQAKGNLWQKLTARSPGFEVAIRWRPENDPSSGLMHVVISIKCLNEGEGGLRALNQMGPALLESFRALLEKVHDRRGEKRWPCPHPLAYYPVINEMDLGERIAGQGEDISANGIRFRTARKPPSPQAYIHLPLSPSTAGIAVLADFIRVRTLEEGQLFEVAARFKHKVAEPRPSYLDVCTIRR